jgi:hypothetical protein
MTRHGICQPAAFFTETMPSTAPRRRNEPMRYRGIARITRAWIRSGPDRAVNSRSASTRSSKTGSFLWINHLFNNYGEANVIIFT